MKKPQEAILIDGRLIPTAAFRPVTGAAFLKTHEKILDFKPIPFQKMPPAKALRCHAACPAPQESKMERDAAKLTDSMAGKETTSTLNFNLDQRQFHDSLTAIIPVRLATQVVAIIQRSERQLPVEVSTDRIFFHPVPPSEPIQVTWRNNGKSNHSAKGICKLYEPTHRFYPDLRATGNFACMASG